MHPGRGENGADALRDHRHVRDGNAVPLRDVVGEGLHVAHGDVKAGTVAALARRAAVPARVPGEDGVIGQRQLVGKMRDAAGMLVAAMEEQDCAGGPLRCGGPMAIEEFDAVMRREGQFLDGAHSRLASPMGACRFSHREGCVSGEVKGSIRLSPQAGRGKDEGATSLIAAPPRPRLPQGRRGCG